MNSHVPLSEKLADALPLPIGANLKLHHVSTPPTPSSRAIFAAAPGAKEQSTFCESHFLAITIPTPSHCGLLALAAEILIFTTADLTLIFVSKVDTTGYLYNDKVPKNRDISKIIISTFLQYLLNARPAGSKVVLSLFARAEEQYLFPGSGNNGAKRIVGDRTLVKWWCRVLDPVLRYSEFSKTSERVSQSCPTAHVLVAGSDTNERKKILPPSTTKDPPDRLRWLWSYPTSLVAPDPSAPSQCLIPRLPDDPKTRYLEELDEEVEKHGRWTSVETITQFWEVMDTRKECAAGRAVGYIWMIFPPAKNPNQTIRHQENGNLPTSPKHLHGVRLATPEQPQNGGTSATDLLTLATQKLQPLVQSVSPPSSSPIDTSSGSKDSESISSKPDDGPQYYDEAHHLPVSWPESSRGDLVVSGKQYQALMDVLLQLDFESPELAEASTRTWIQKGVEIQPAASDAATQAWGVDVIGHSIDDQMKRKADGLEHPVDAASQQKPTVNTLSAGLLRKKPKVK